MPDLKFNISAHAETPTKVVVKARSFQLIVDEPAALGGQDDGPTPVEYLLSAAVGCVNVVLHLIARERGIRLDSVKFHAEGPLNPERLLAQGNTDRAGFKKIHLEVDIESPASREKIEDLLGAVETRCPVSDNLSNPTPIGLYLAPAR